MSKKYPYRMYPSLMALLMIQGEEPDQSNVVKKLRSRIGHLPFGLVYVPYTSMVIKRLKKGGCMYALVIEFELKNLKSKEMVRELYHVKKFFRAVEQLLLDLSVDEKAEGFWPLFDVQNVFYSEDQIGGEE